MTSAQLVTGARVAARRLSRDGAVDAANAVSELVGAYRHQVRLLAALRELVSVEAWRAAEARASRER